MVYTLAILSCIWAYLSKWSLGNNMFGILIFEEAVSAMIRNKQIRKDMLCFIFYIVKPNNTATHSIVNIVLQKMVTSIQCDVLF